MIDIDLLLTDRTYVLERLKRDAFRRTAPLLYGRVIDLGCGQGQYRRFLGAGADYLGIDRTVTSAVSIVGDAGHIPLRDTCADALILTEVLEHVPDPALVLAEVHRILRPGGIAYVSVPMSWPLHGDPHDYYRFTPYGIGYLAAQAGLTVGRISRIGGLVALIAVRMIDALGTLVVERPMIALRIERGRWRVPALVLSPVSLLSYYAARLLDPLWDRDAIGWSFVLEKRRSEE